MILHTETNDAVLILDDLLQLKQFGTNMLSTCVYIETNDEY